MNSRTIVPLDNAQQFIGGQWCQGNGRTRIDNRNPYDGSLLTSIDGASPQDVNEAFEAAHDAQAAWRDTAPTVRRDVFLCADSILAEQRSACVDIIVRETGSSQAKANAEIDALSLLLKECASFPTRMHGRIFDSNIPGKTNFVIREPLGVVGVISPFNFPCYLSMRSAGPALAMGNAVVLKPDPQTFLSGGLILARLFEDAGLPRGVLNVVVADTTELGDAFVAHRHIAKLAFTGSTKVGRMLGTACASHMKASTLELGGNNPIIVLADADLELALEASIFARFLHQSQICMSANRIIVHESLHDAFVQRFVEKTRRLVVGDPRNPETLIGPLINQRQADRVRQLIEDSLAAGAQVALQGSIDGNLVSPFVLTNMRRDMACVKDEVFGPVASIFSFQDEEEAFAIANDTAQNLSASVFSASTGRALEFARRLKAGMVHINDQTVNDEPHVLFGGCNDAGTGNYGGEWSMNAFSRERWVSVQNVPRQYFGLG